MKQNVKRAVALRYDAVGDLPELSLCEQGESAAHMVSLARKHNIPVLERAELTGLLFEVGFDEEIPEQLYQAIALIVTEVEDLTMSSNA